jgi:hypothetical protein
MGMMMMMMMMRRRRKKRKRMLPNTYSPQVYVMVPVSTSTGRNVPATMVPLMMGVAK